jgi:hypothetical protein
MLRSVSSFLVVACGLVSGQAGAFANGAPGDSQVGCNQCHSGGGSPNVQLSGPSTVAPSSANTFSFTISGGAGGCGGLDVSANGAALSVSGSDGPNDYLDSGDITQSSPTNFSGASLVYTFTVTAGTGSSLTLYAAGLSGCSNSDSSSSETSLTVPISSGGSANPPTVAQPARATASTVANTTTGVSALGASSGGESGLTYTWSSTPPGVTFSPNGNNAAQSATATFASAGSYALTVTIAGAGGSVTSQTSVTVMSTPSSLDVTPNAPSVPAAGSVAFAASIADQFGASMGPATGVTWSATGDGTIDANGGFTAGGQAGTATVMASASAFAASTAISVGQATNPVVSNGTLSVQWLMPAMSASVTGITLLRVAANDPSGISAMTFVVDGENLLNETGPNFEARWDSTTVSNGQHTLSAQAINGNGVSAMSTITVDVVNGPSSQGSGCSSSGPNASALPLLGLAAVALMLRGGRRKGEVAS